MENMSSPEKNHLSLIDQITHAVESNNSNAIIETLVRANEALVGIDKGHFDSRNLEVQIP